uniref:protein-tyrosine-phosphatase n=1 Tax=Hucho hucho TaxID=62062 RepID=A0A4W5L9Y8_9TELE
MQQNDIAYVLNASNTCPKPDYIPESHFLRVPVNDSFCEKILPWLDRSVEFIEKAKASDGCVLVHCLAGISRSATIAIAYIMTRMDMSLDEAYRFVKEKRPTISPNFNFLGQLLDFEKKIKTPGSHPDPALALLEPLTLPCVLAPWPPEERLLAQALQGLQGLQLDEGTEDSAARLKRSFSLDIKSYREPGAQEYYNPSVSFKEPAGKPCQFSPVKEMSEQSTPEPSPDKEQDDGPADPTATPVLHRSGSMEESSNPTPNHTPHTTGFLFGGGANILGGGSVAAYSVSQGLEEVRRRRSGRQRSGDRGDSRRSWHEESTLEKQLKRRSCQMELGDRMRGGGGETRSREEMGS